MKLPKIVIVTLFAVTALANVFFASTVLASPYPFPVIGNSSFVNDFDAPRDGGPHHAIDIIANKRQKIISRTDGVVTFVGYPQPSWGYAVFVRADNGYTYRYLHINNDTPGTDDGNGGGYYAYGPDIVPGKRVIKGQLLGYVGDSGNAENTVSHLHFEAFDDGEAINPYNGLKNNSVYLGSSKLDYPTAEDEILPTGTFTGGASIALGDVDGDSTDEIITGAGTGGKYVKTFELNGEQIGQFAPNGTSFLGGVDVAVGDVDGDGTDEIITGAGTGGSYVKAFELDGSQLTKFAPNGAEFDGGVDVTSGDVDGDGTDEIITGAGTGGKYVKTFELNGEQIDQFAPYGEFTKGISVTSGNVTGGAEDEIITGAHQGGGPRVSIFSANGTPLASYYAYTSTFKGGVKVEAADLSGATPYDEIVTVPQSGGAPRVKMLDITGNVLSYSDYFAEEWWKGYYNIAASDNLALTSLGTDRRTSLRFAENL